MTDKMCLTQNLAFGLSFCHKLQVSASWVPGKKRKHIWNSKARRYKGPDWKFIVYKSTEVRVRKGRGVWDISGEELVGFKWAQFVRWCHPKRRRSVIWQGKPVSELCQAQHRDKDQVRFSILCQLVVFTHIARPSRSSAQDSQFHQNHHTAKSIRSSLKCRAGIVTCTFLQEETLQDSGYAVVLRRKFSKFHDVWRNGVRFPASPITDRNVGVHLKWQCISDFVY